LKDCHDKGLLRKNSLPPEAVDSEMSSASHHLENARQCVMDGMFDLAIVSVYTCMFHTARALLYRDGIKERSHICIIEYVKEKYPDLDSYARTLDAYRHSRHTMLYGADVTAMKDDATEGIEVAVEFMEAVGEKLG
jgi:uncharacterized protein (UPF0332 family)